MNGGLASLPGLWVDTLRALAAPRRAIPIAVVVAAMLVAQHHFGSWRYDVPSVTMATLFVALAPFSWRALFPGDGRVERRGLRLLAYTLLCATPTLAGWGAGQLVGIDTSFITYRFHLPVTATLFFAGGWGLARDIQLEEGLDRAERRAEALRRDAERAQLLAIRAHLDPHFLFNTLNAIAEYCREDGEAAERAILRLSGLLREVLGGIRASSWPLEKELGLLRDVLELHRMRDPSWFTVAWEVGEAAEVEIPPLLLLPLAENAVKHGPAKGHRGPIEVIVRPTPGGGLRVRITNPGPWGGPRDGGTGLSTVHRRLVLAYGEQATLELPERGAASAVDLFLPSHRPLEAT